MLEANPRAFVDPVHVDSLLRNLCEAAGGHDLTTTIPPLCRAAATVYAHFQHRPMLPVADRHALLITWRFAEEVARTVLPASYCEGRGNLGFAGVFALLYGSGEGIGPPERAVTDEQMELLILSLRIFVNDLDSICAALALALIDPDTNPLAVLLGAPGLPGHEPEPEPAATMH